MLLGVPKETFPNEHRVAMVPDVIPSLNKRGLDVIVESGAGVNSGYTDQHYQHKGGKITTSRKEVLSADIVAYVRSLGSNPEGQADLDFLKPNQVVLGLGDPLRQATANLRYAEKAVRYFALELIPRISRAQSMDVLSSQASLSGYKAVLLGAQHLNKVFPMMMTAAGTLQPAKVFILGAGVAGLQAIATARRLGARVFAYDIRAEVKEQIESLGASFVELPLETQQSKDSGGYAKDQGEDFLRKQRELMTKTLASSDLVITTADIPGKKAPILITSDMVKSMQANSVIVDMAALNGGNCELSKVDEIVHVNGVTILGPSNLASGLAHHASQMFAKNVANFVALFVKDGQLSLNLEDEILRGTLVCENGKLVHEKLLGQKQGEA